LHSELFGLGALILVAGLLARGGRRLGLPSVPLFMAAGILFGPSTPGPVLIEHPEDLTLLASIGLVLLLFHIGIEFPVEQVLGSGRRLLVAAGSYIGLNIAAGLAVGFALGWGVPEAFVIAGAMGISSSAIATKLLIELRRLTNAETPVILGIIVLEDLFLAFYLALISPILTEADSALELIGDVATSFGFLAALFLLARFGARAVGMLVDSHEDDLVAVLMFGLVALVAGLSQEVGVSEAIGALMIGLVLSRTSLNERIERIVLPLRDVFAAVFFVVFGLTIDVGDLAAVAVPVAFAVVATGVMNTISGVIAARVFGFNQRSAANIGLTIFGRGEFSLILATLAIGAGLDDRIGPFVALYVLVLAILAPVLAARSRDIARVLPLWLMRPGWRFVEEETITTACAHLDQIRVTRTDVDVCPDCVELDDDWVELRMCLFCGYVGCCDDSRNHHATGHFENSGHAIIRSIEPGGDWRYCYVDGTLVQEPLGRRPATSS